MAKRPPRVRDPIHGLIELSEREVQLINTRVFQRLRRIRQLAMAFLVYPGALHTRFDHSIGVMHIAGRICAELKKDRGNKISKEDIEKVRFAALLHDIGHGPFSHTSEDILAAVNNTNKDGIDSNTDGKQDRKKIHEKITADIIQMDSDISHILDSDERDFVVKLIKDKDMWDWRRNIISSDLDADKMDYLLRDAYFAGVKYGQYDLEQIIESCRIYKAEGGATTLVMSSAGIYALEQLLLARYHMTQQVYQHRVSLISDQMIIRGIALAIREGNAEIEKLYQYDENNKENFIQRYLNYHDEKLIDVLRNCEGKKACEIFNRLYHRKLFKMVAELSLNDVEDGVTQLKLLKMADTQKLEWEREIANCLGIDPDYVILYKHQIPSPDYGSRNKILSSESIKIFDDKLRRPKNIWDYAKELSFVRPNDADALSLETVQIYAPLDSDQKKRAKLEKAVRKIFKVT